ncbi:ABC transporter permease [Variovorax dokdonensis]|uniref:ABC transporter permease n=1 Tax=Variovorax dokdonensis TaxID=344883 RepID=A0ABT7N7H7_9BURK|nr:ABC transporter permease [Variovorax dokdonensis]MDM0043903.1 ABC transporter permease [Variovorax dokdonensis]
MFLLILIGSWELATRRDWVDPTFFGSPSGVAAYLWSGLFVTGSIFKDLGWTIAATLISFVLGSAAALLLGLAFARFPSLQEFCEPYLAAINAMPRIALAPMFLLWFGLGIGSKIAAGVSLTFFIVLSSTIAGVRGVLTDWVILSQTLGATPTQLFCKVTLPSAVPVIFSGLRLGLVYSLLGVVGCELIASEHGLGQQIAYLSSSFNMSGVMGLLLLLALLGMGATWLMNRIEKVLLAWQ